MMEEAKREFIRKREEEEEKERQVIKKRKEAYLKDIQA